MPESEKRPFFTTLPGILTGTAALIGALTTAYVALRPGSNVPARNAGPALTAQQAGGALPESAHVVPAGTQSAAAAPSRQEAERVAGEFMAALLSRDLDRIVSLAETPFYFDQQVLVSKVAVRSGYERLFQEKPAAGQGVQISSMHARTLAELRQQGQDMRRDRVVANLSMLDTDWAIEILFNYDGRQEGMMMFARAFDGGLRIVGVWD